MPGLSGFYTSWVRCGLPSEPSSTPASKMPCSTALMYTVNIIDCVLIPESLELGEYLLSWRWDAEQSAQVWQNCADVLIIDGEAARA